MLQISDMSSASLNHRLPQQLIDLVNQKAKAPKFRQFKQGLYYGDILNGTRHGFGTLVRYPRPNVIL